MPATPDDTEFAGERRALRWSMACGLSLAIVGIAIGVASASTIILFDGFYTFLGIGLSWMALRVSFLVEAGPTTRYPFGREALTPLIIGVEGVALLATCAYAAFNSVLSLVNGGAPTPSYGALVYAGLAAVLPLVLWAWMRRVARHSELARAEATQWLSGAALGFAMLVAFVFARLIIGTSWAPADRDVSPVLVLLACAIFIGPPLRMIRTTFIELVEGSPDQDLAEPVAAVLAQVADEFDLPTRHLRMTKVGRKFYVELDFVVEPAWTVHRSDEVRRALARRLASIPHEIWLTVEFTADPTLVA